MAGEPINRQIKWQKSVQTQTTLYNDVKQFL